METFRKCLRPIGLVFAYLGITLLLGAVLVSLGFEDETVLSIGMIVASTVASGFVVFMVRHKLAGQAADFKMNFSKDMKIALKNWGLGFVGMIVTNAILISLLGGIAPNEEANREMMGMFFVYSAIYTCILAPVAEELLFRLNFADCFKDKRTYVIITALLFGGLHVITNIEVWTDVLYIIPYSVLGYAFSKTYAETENVYSSIAVHMLHNILAIVLIVCQL